MTDQIDNWSWSKFFSGFINGKNYAKALVMMFCMIVILTIVISVFSFIKSKFHKPIPTQTVGQNLGTITTNNEDKHGNSFSLFNIFNSR